MCLFTLSGFPVDVFSVDSGLEKDKLTMKDFGVAGCCSSFCTGVGGFQVWVLRDTKKNFLDMVIASRQKLQHRCFGRRLHCFVCWFEFMLWVCCVFVSLLSFVLLIQI
jgi:hypothetical protein